MGKLLDASGQQTQASQVIEINVRPGWKTGTKITFSEMGDEAPGTIPADLVFVVQEIPHNTFKREKNDLIVTSNISLKDALCGTAVMVVTPNYTKRVAGECMPVAKDPSQKGDLVLKFNVRWPSHLSEQQKKEIANIL